MSSKVAEQIRQKATQQRSKAIPTGNSLSLPSHQKVIASAAVTQARQDMQAISDGYQAIEDALVNHAINCEERTRNNVAARLSAYWAEQSTSDFFDVGTEIETLLAVPLPALAVPETRTLPQVN
jgi:hypothetical protein